MPRHLRRLQRIIVTSLAVSTIAGLSPSNVAASPIDDQRQKVQQITDELEALEEQSDILAEDHVTAIDEEQRLAAEVAVAEQRVAEKQAQVDALRGELADVAVRAYIGAGGNGFGPLLADTPGLTEQLQREQLSRVALNAGTATTDELDEAVSDLDQERAGLEDKRDAATEQAERVEDAREANEEKKAEYEQARQAAEAELGALIREEEERRARESYERMQREAEEAAARAAAAARESQAAQQRTVQQVATPAARQSASPSNGGGGGASPAAAAAPAAAAPSIPAASSRAGTAINAAMTQLGVPWIFAMSEPGVGFDCSGLTMWAWAQAGVSMPHQSRAQFASLPQVPTSEAQPGDLIFYYSPISHVGIYLGGGQLIHAPNSGSVVNIATVNWSKVVGVARPG